MKKLRKFFLVLPITVFLVALGLLAAGCKGDSKVTLKFESNGGTACERIVAEPGTTVELPESTKEQFALEGWYDNKELEGTGVKGSITVPEKSTTYYAKWVTGYRLTLDLDGGTLSESAPSFWLAEGASVFGAVRDLAPSKSGFTFGAWFADGVEVTGSYRMPAAELTIKARYKVQYTMETYLQNVARNSYVNNPEFTAYGSDYVGDTVSPEAPLVLHFTATDAPEGNAADGKPYTPVTTQTLSEDPTQNIFKFYYTRNSYTLTYRANAPLGLASSGSVAPQSVVYQGSVNTSPNAFSVYGYRFAGWSTQAGGDVEYQAGARITVTDNTDLYAVWDRGYRDRFGTEDVIFFPRLEPGKAILFRGGREFEGVRTENQFSFDRPAGKLTGMVYGNMFSYDRADVAGKYVFYNGRDSFPGADEPDGRYDEKRFDPKITLEIDKNLNATYTKGDHVCKGYLEFDYENGDYVFTGSDETFRVLFSKNGAQAGAKYQNIFSIGGNELGIYEDFVITNPTLGAGFSTGQILFLDGYGNASLYVAASGMGYLQYDGFYSITGEISQNGVALYRTDCWIYDPLGALGDEPGWYLQSFYTMPLAGGDSEVHYDAFITANEFIGEYTGANGAKLTLDGIGFFSDSAVYVDGGKTYEGTFTYLRDNKSGFVVTMTTENETFRFRLNITAYGTGTFEPFTEKESYHEYYLLTNQLDSPLLVIYDTPTDGKYKAELYVSKDDGMTYESEPAATGYCTKEGTDYARYTFTRTSLAEGYTDLPAKIVFYITEVFSAETFRSQDVYCAFEYGSEVWYREYQTDDGGKIWANLRVGLEGVGSLYFTADGRVIEGSATVERSENFEGTYLEFLYGDAMGNSTVLRFRVTEQDNGKFLATRTQGEEMSLYIYVYWEDDGTALYAQDLILDDVVLEGASVGHKGAARFNDAFGEGTWQNATYELIGSTPFGDNVFSLTVGGVVRFKFTIFLMGNGYGGYTPVYFRYNTLPTGTPITGASLDGKYKAEGGGDLELDGYFWAAYTDAKGTNYAGTYSLDPEGKLIYFTPVTGEAFYISIDRENKTFVALDEAYGVYELIDANYNPINNAVITFDGKGHVSIAFQGDVTRTGEYTLLDAAKQEYIVHANFGDQYGLADWHVMLFNGALANGCMVFDEKRSGTFINDNWDVLSLDGFGNGSLYSADGSLAGSGLYTIASEERGFIIFSFDDYSTEALLVMDSAKHTFEILDFTKFGNLYLSNEMDYLALCDNGIIRIGRLAGYYFYTSEAIYAFVTDYETNYKWEELPLPVAGSSTYTYNHKTYYLWDGKAVTIDGKIEFYDKDGKAQQVGSLDATFTFTPTVGGNFNLPARFTVKDGDHHGDYDGFLFNIYSGGKLNPRVTYEGVDYYITFDYKGTAAGSSFTVRAGYVETPMQDYYAGWRDDDGGHHGGLITRERNGFGPIDLAGATYSGKFLYHNEATPGADATPWTFTNVSVSDIAVIGYRVGLGNCYEIVFEHESKKYAIDFYEATSEDRGPVYVLQGFYEYDEFTLTEYKVRVKYLYIATTPNSPGYGDDDMIGRPCAVTLIPTATQKAIVNGDSGISINRDVWFWEFKGINDKGDAIAGPAYLVKFTYETDGKKVKSVEVNQYTLKQASPSGYMINYLVDENNNVVDILMVAYQENQGHYWLSNTHDLEHEEGSETWTFYGTEGEASMEQKYILQFVPEKDDAGKIIGYTVSIKIDEAGS